MKYEKGSFITVPNRASILGIGAGPQALYMWLCAHANLEGECFPARSTLAKEIGCSDRSIDSYIETLTVAGLLKKEHQFSNNEFTSNKYWLPLGGSEKSSLGSEKSSPQVAKNLRIELNPVLTQSIEEGAEREISQEDRISSRVIPTPYSVQKTKEAWSRGELRLQVLNWYFDEAGLWSRATTKVRLQALMRRHNNAAVRIAKAEWTPKELKEAKRNIDFNDSLSGQWTLETVEKYVTK